MLLDVAAVEEKTTDGRGLPWSNVTNEYMSVRLVLVFHCDPVVPLCVKQRGGVGAYIKLSSKIRIWTNRVTAGAESLVNEFNCKIKYPACVL